MVTRPTHVPAHGPWWVLLGDIACIICLRPGVCRRDAELAMLAFGNEGGQARAKAQAYVLGSLVKMYKQAGGDRRRKSGCGHAAGVMAVLLLHDPRHPPIPTWLAREFAKYEQDVRQAVAEASRARV